MDMAIPARILLEKTILLYSIQLKFSLCSLFHHSLSLSLSIILFDSSLFLPISFICLYNLPLLSLNSPLFPYSFLLIFSSIFIPIVCGVCIFYTSVRVLYNQRKMKDYVSVCVYGVFSIEDSMEECIDNMRYLFFVTVMCVW